MPIQPVGLVVALWRYPVKSMQGEQLNHTQISERGILGDRTYAIFDRSTGHIASAKHPRKWSKLLECRAAFVSPPQMYAPLPPIWITLPDGNSIRSDQADVDHILSRVLERDVTLITTGPATPTREADRTPIDDSTAPPMILEEVMALAAPAGTFFDYAVLHILSTATLDRLRELHPAGHIEDRRFRPNIVIATKQNEPGFTENAWLGHILTNTNKLRLQLIDPCPRCVVTTLAQGDLPRDAGMLRTLSQHNTAASVTLAPGVMFAAVAGVYASVLEPGHLHQGDPLHLE